MKKYFTLCAFVTLSVAIKAQTTTCVWIGSSDTVWTNTSNWDGGIIPASGDTLIIQDGTYQPYLNSNLMVADLTIDSGAVFNVGEITLTVIGDWNNSGTFNAGMSTVLLAGTTLQTLNGNQTFYNLQIDNESGVEISAGTNSLRAVLTLITGSFSTNDSFVILSDSTGTGSIGPIQSGAVQGSITMQRYMDIFSADWRFLSSPVANFTLSQISDDFWTSGFAGSTYPSEAFISVYYYDETDTGTADYGYVSPGSINDTVPVGSGFMAYIGSLSLTGIVDFTGTPNTGTINLPVTYTLSDTVSDGWNLVGNPYPSAIDWDHANITKTGIDNAIYLWNPAYGTYATYVDGIGTNGGTGVIAAGQSFYVKANAASPVLQVTEACKTAQPSEFLKTDGVSTYLTILIENSYGHDETVLKENGNASNGFDNSYDAYKMFGGFIGAPMIFTSMNNSGVAYSINQFPGQEQTIPLTIYTGSSEVHTISFTGLQGFSNASCIYLEDLYTGISYNLAETSEISVFISDTTTAPRFLLKLGAPVYSLAHDATCYGFDNGSIDFGKQSNQLFGVTLLDAYGGVLASEADVNQIITFNNLDAGLYLVEWTDQLCGTMVDSILIGQPPLIVSAFGVSEDTLYFTGTSVEVMFSNESVYAAYYSWDFGDFGTSTAVDPVYAFDAPGVYNVTLYAYQNAGCFESSEHEIYVVNSLGVEVSENETASIRLVNGILFVMADEAAVVEITDLAGRILWSGAVEAGENQILMSEIPTQILLVTLKQTNSILTKKISFN